MAFMNWFDWLYEHKYLIFAFSAAFFLVGVIVMRFAVVAMPADYFVRRDSHFDGWFTRHPVTRWGLLVLKNVVGYVCLAVGGLMLITPGPGILMLLAGLSLINFPGKRVLEARLAQLPSIRKQIDALRKKHNRPPLKYPQNTAANTPSK